MLFRSVSVDSGKALTVGTHRFASICSFGAHDENEMIITAANNRGLRELNPEISSFLKVYCINVLLDYLMHKSMYTRSAACWYWYSDRKKVK